MRIVLSSLNLWIMRINRRKLVGLLAALALLPGPSAWADRGRGRGRGGHDEDDYEDAYKARRSGDILPFSAILTEVRAAFPGEVVGVEFEREDGKAIYEVKVLQDNGRYLEVYVDARTGIVTKVEGK